MVRPALGNISAERRVLWELFTMIPAQTFIPVLLLPLSVLMLTSGLRATGQTASPVRLYVREVPLEVLGKKVRTVEIVQGDGTRGALSQKIGRLQCRGRQPTQSPHCSSLARAYLASADGRSPVCQPGANSARWYDRL